MSRSFARRLGFGAGGLAFALVLACAGTRSASRSRPSRSIETLPDGTMVVCEMERPTGSHIAEPVCRRLDEIERTRAATQHELLRPRSAPAQRE